MESVSELSSAAPRHRRVYANSDGISRGENGDNDDVDSLELEETVEDDEDEEGRFNNDLEDASFVFEEDEEDDEDEEASSAGSVEADLRRSSRHRSMEHEPQRRSVSLPEDQEDFEDLKEYIPLATREARAYSAQRQHADGLPRRRRQRREQSLDSPGAELRHGHDDDDGDESRHRKRYKTSAWAPKTKEESPHIEHGDQVGADVGGFPFVSNQEVTVFEVHSSSDPATAKVRTDQVRGRSPAWKHWYVEEGEPSFMRIIFPEGGKDEEENGDLALEDVRVEVVVEGPEERPRVLHPTTLTVDVDSYLGLPVSSPLAPGLSLYRPKVQQLLEREAEAIAVKLERENVLPAGRGGAAANPVDSTTSTTATATSIVQPPQPLALDSSSSTTTPGNLRDISAHPPVRPLAFPEDPHYLTPLHCLIRNQLEIFVATPSDIQLYANTGRRHPVVVGKVGVRCKHCARAVLSPSNAHDPASSTSALVRPTAATPSKRPPWPPGSVSYPVNVAGLHSVCAQKPVMHFCGKCPYLPSHVKLEFQTLLTRGNPQRRKRRALPDDDPTMPAPTHIKMKAATYYELCARRIGLVDAALVGGEGIRYARDPSLPPLSVEDVLSTKERPTPNHSLFSSMEVRSEKGTAASSSTMPPTASAAAAPMVPSAMTTTGATVQVTVERERQDSGKDNRSRTFQSDLLAGDRRLVGSSDKTLVTDFWFLSLQQITLCVASPKDCHSRRHVRKSSSPTLPLRVGVAGFCCRHCSKRDWTTVAAQSDEEEMEADQPRAGEENVDSVVNGDMLPPVSGKENEDEKGGVISWEKSNKTTERNVPPAKQDDYDAVMNDKVRKDDSDKSIDHERHDVAMSESVRDVGGGPNTSLDVDMHTVDDSFNRDGNDVSMDRSTGNDNCLDRSKDGNVAAVAHLDANNHAEGEENSAGMKEQDQSNYFAKALMGGVGGLGGGADTTCRTFSSAPDHLASSISEKVFSHLQRCRAVPAPLKSTLAAFKKNHSRQLAQLPHGSQRHFAHVLWNRLRQADLPEEEAQNLYNRLLHQQQQNASAVEQKTESEEPSSTSNREGPVAPTAIISKGTVAALETPASVASSLSVAQDRRSSTTIGPNGIDRIEGFPTSKDETTQRLLGQAMQSNPAENDMLVFKEDRSLITDYVFFLLKQLRAVRPSPHESMLGRPRAALHRVEQRTGIGCKYCVERRHVSSQASGRSFPSAPDNIASSFNASLYNHMQKCASVPADVSHALSHLKQLHPGQMASIWFGAQRKFFQILFSRLRDLDQQELPAKISAELSTKDDMVTKDEATGSSSLKATTVHGSCYDNGDNFAELRRYGFIRTAGGWYTCQRCRMVPLDLRVSGAVAPSRPTEAAMREHHSSCLEDGLDLRVVGRAVQNWIDSIPGSNWPPVSDLVRLEKYRCMVQLLCHNDSELVWAFTEGVATILEQDGRAAEHDSRRTSVCLGSTSLSLDVFRKTKGLWSRFSSGVMERRAFDRTAESLVEALESSSTTEQNGCGRNGNVDAARTIPQYQNASFWTLIQLLSPTFCIEAQD